MFEPIHKTTLTDAERKAATEIIRENAKWAKQRGLSFVADEREQVAQKIEAGDSISIDLYRAVTARLSA